MQIKKILLIIAIIGLASYAVFLLFGPQTSTMAINDQEPVGITDEIEGRLTFPIIDTPGHTATGTVSIFETEQGQAIVRLNDFETVNGPDLFVYVANDTEASRFVSLGLLQSTSGNQNYVVPDGTSLEEYPFVLVWCKRFGVLFSYADTSQTKQ